MEGTAIKNEIGYAIQTSVKRWGNSQGIRLSKAIMAQMNLKENDTVRINVYDGKMTIEKVSRPKYINLTGRLETFYKKPIEGIYVESTQEVDVGSSVAFVCPIANTIKKHPFHIELDERVQTTGVILCDQAKMLDIGARNAQFKEECPEDIWKEARELVISFM